MQTRAYPLRAGNSTATTHYPRNNISIQHGTIKPPTTNNRLPAESTYSTTTLAASYHPKTLPSGWQARHTTTTRLNPPSPSSSRGKVLRTITSSLPKEEPALSPWRNECNRRSPQIDGQSVSTQDIITSLLSVGAPTTSPSCGG